MATLQWVLNSCVFFWYMQFQPPNGVICLKEKETKTLGRDVRSRRRDKLVHCGRFKPKSSSNEPDTKSLPIKYLHTGTLAVISKFNNY